MLNYVIFFDMDHMHTGFPMHLVTNLVVNLVPHMLINFCWHAACVGFRTVDEKKIFQCVICRPIPNVFVINGIAMGL